MSKLVALAKTDEKIRKRIFSMVRCKIFTDEEIKLLNYWRENKDKLQDPITQVNIDVDDFYRFNGEKYIGTIKTLQKVKDAYFIAGVLDHETNAYTQWMVEIDKVSGKITPLFNMMNWYKTKSPMEMNEEIKKEIEYPEWLKPKKEE